jgi:hypothetical protein
MRPERRDDGKGARDRTSLAVTRRFGAVTDRDSAIAAVSDA